MNLASLFQDLPVSTAFNQKLIVWSWNARKKFKPQLQLDAEWFHALISSMEDY
jgi:hypothetical protein